MAVLSQCAEGSADHFSSLSTPFRYNSVEGDLRALRECEVR